MLVVFLLQQWLQECASMLIYTYIFCIVKIDSWKNVFVEGLLNVLIIIEISELFIVRIFVRI